MHNPLKNLPEEPYTFIHQNIIQYIAAHLRKGRKQPLLDFGLNAQLATMVLPINPDQVMESSW